MTRELFLLALVLCLSQQVDADGSPPNIVVVLADDLGYGDLGCYGHPVIKTPHIDRFAAEGLRLTDCYAAHPNCSPARTGLMTGRTPFRVGIYNWIPMHSPMHVRESEITIATLLRDAGYDTCHVGKWHMNGDFNGPSQPQPNDHGFNHWYSTQNNALPNHRDPNNFVRNGEDVGQLTGYSAQLVAAEAKNWLRNIRDKEKPFFLFACFHEPHEPIASAEQFTDRYKSDDPSLLAHHGNVSQLDDGFGTILAALDERQQRENTFIFFTSDNGPAITSIHPHGSAGNLRDKKGAIYEGGIRVPGIIQWPGRVQASSVSDVPVSGVDVLPTLCELAGITASADRTLDGQSFLPILSGKQLRRDKPLYWQFNRAKSKAKVAMRDGDWKIVASLDTPDPKSGGGIPADEITNIKKANLVDFELFHLKTDVAESVDVSEEHADRFESLKNKLQEFYVEVRSEAPHWPVWEWEKYESKLIQWPDYRRRSK